MKKKIFHLSRKQKKLNRLKPKGVIKYYTSKNDPTGIFGYIDNICKRYDLSSGVVTPTKLSKEDLNDRSIYSKVFNLDVSIKNKLRDAMRLKLLKHD